MFRKRFFLFVVVLNFVLLTGCVGAADYDIDLPGDYSILRTSAHEVTIASKKSETSWGANKIPAKVTEVGWSDDYIIAKQSNLTEDPESSSRVEIPDGQNYSYWVLKIENGVVTGPLDDSEFAKKKEEFEISDEVILKKVENLGSDK